MISEQLRELYTQENNIMDTLEFGTSINWDSYTDTVLANEVSALRGFTQQQMDFFQQRGIISPDTHTRACSGEFVQLNKSESGNMLSHYLRLHKASDVTISFVLENFLKNMTDRSTEGISISQYQSIELRGPIVVITLADRSEDLKNLLLGQNNGVFIRGVQSNFKHSDMPFTIIKSSRSYEYQDERTLRHEWEHVRQFFIKKYLHEISYRPYRNMDAIGLCRAFHKAYERVLPKPDALIHEVQKIQSLMPELLNFFMDQDTIKTLGYRKTIREFYEKIADELLCQLAGDNYHTYMSPMHSSDSISTVVTYSPFHFVFPLHESIAAAYGQTGIDMKKLKNAILNTDKHYKDDLLWRQVKHRYQIMRLGSWLRIEKQDEFIEDIGQLLGILTDSSRLGEYMRVIAQEITKAKIAYTKMCEQYDEYEVFFHLSQYPFVDWFDMVSAEIEIPDQFVRYYS